MGPSFAASVAIIGSFRYSETAKPHTRPELHLLRKWLVRTLYLLIPCSLKALPSPAVPYWSQLWASDTQTCQTVPNHSASSPGRSSRLLRFPIRISSQPVLPIYTRCRQALNSQVKVSQECCRRWQRKPISRADLLTLQRGCTCCF